LLARTIRDDFATAGCFFNGEKRSASTGLSRNPPVRDGLVSAVFAYKSLLIIADSTATFPLYESSPVPLPVSFGTGGRGESRRGETALSNSLYEAVPSLRKGFLCLIEL